MGPLPPYLLLVHTWKKVTRTQHPDTLAPCTPHVLHRWKSRHRRLCPRLHCNISPLCPHSAFSCLLPDEAGWVWSHGSDDGPAGHGTVPTNTAERPDDSGENWETAWLETDRKPNKADGRSSGGMTKSRSSIKLGRSPSIVYGTCHWIK